MQRQTPGHNRWTTMSVAAMVMSLGCSVGCVSLKHHMNRHSVVSKIAEKYDGRYYHCPHCGQIIPRVGFSKCPRCLQIPLYHGYEPTCWRQWPDGWGCPPESVAGHPQFYSDGMLESDTVTPEYPEVTPEGPESEDEPPAALDVPSPEPDPKRIRTDVSLPPTQNDAVAQMQPADDVGFSMIADNAAAEPVATAEPEKIETVQQPLTSHEPLAGVDPSQNKPLQDDQRREPSAAEQEVTPSPMVAQRRMPDPPAAEDSALSLPPAAALATMTPSVAKIEEVAEPKKAASVVSQTEQELAVENAAASKVPHTSAGKVPQLAQEIVAEQPTAPEPVLVVLNRIPIPTRKVILSTEESAEVTAEVVRPTPGAATLVQSEAQVIDAFGSLTEDKPVKVAKKSAAKISPRDDQGPIPVRKLKLAEAAGEGLPQTDAKAGEEFPAPVNRIAVPTLAQPSPSQIKRGQFPTEPYPAPVRRIQLSELPIRIQR